MKNPFSTKSVPMTTLGGKSAGILDDYKTSKVVETKEINMQKSNSTTMVTNLNADLLDGQHASDFVEPADAIIANHPHQNVNTTASPTFANVVITAGGDIMPSSNSTTAINIAQADGTNFASFDTTNKRLGINCTPTQALEVGSSVGIKNISGISNSILTMSSTSAGYSYMATYQDGSGFSNIISIDHNKDQLQWCLYDRGGRQLVVCGERWGDDYAHAVQTNPTIYIHSSTAAGTSTAQWLSLTHDTTNPLIKSGTGNILIDNPQCVGNFFSNDGSTGATGSFTSADSKTITVKNGIITAIV